MRSKPVEILLVEDNPADVDLTRIALNEWKLLNHLSVVSDGVEAMEYLRRVGQFKNAIRPDLILLDLNLPKKDGREVLADIKADLDLKTIPVVVLSTSDADIDVIKSYSRGANCYVTKPIGIDNFMQVIESIGDFWFTIVKLPAMDLLHENPHRTSLPCRSLPSTVLEIRVLVLEDNPPDSDYITEILKGSSNPVFTIFVCNRLSQAMEALKKTRIDVALIDLGLPDSQGIETFATLSAFFPLLPIVINTGLNDDRLALDAIRAGAEDYIVKGDIDSRLLSRVLQYAIERKCNTEERNMLLARERMARLKADEAILARDEFLGIVSHELKTPVTALRMQSALLCQYLKRSPTKVLTERELRLVKGFDDQTARMSGLLEKLLDITQINAGKLKLELGDVNLSDLVGKVLDRFRDGLIAANCSVTFHDDPTATGKWDRSRIDQVVTNLISNAIKYSPGKPITVEVKRNESWVTLTVKDEGSGIKKEDIPRLFKRFERGDNKKAIKGLGLGLYIIQQIVDAHEGSIRVESEYGKGSTFIVELPVRMGASKLAVA